MCRTSRTTRSSTSSSTACRTASGSTCARRSRSAPDVMRIVFCGVGALGSTAAVLCRNLEPMLVFVDFDRVESKNLLAQAFVKQSVGKNKADALKTQLLNFHGTKCEAFGVRLTAENVEQLCGAADLIVDCFDNLASRKVLSEFARRAGKALVHA